MDSPWTFWKDLATLADPVVTVGAVIVAILTIRSSIKSWKWTFFTKEWSTLIQLLRENSCYMEPTRTADYKASFTGADAFRYEMIARLCIGYLDDLYFLGSKKEIRTWFRGSVKLFAETHRKWLEDHEDAYHPGFYKFIMGELERGKLERASKRTWWRFWK